MQGPAEPERANEPEQVVPGLERPRIYADAAEPPSPIEAQLRARLMLGHRAASFQLEEVGGKWRFDFHVDDEVQCRVRCHDAKTHQIVPFAEVWRLALRGFIIEDIGPTTRPLLWQAIACDVCFEAEDGTTRVPTLYVTGARDNVRGLGALVYSSELEAPGHGNLGDRVTRALQSSKIDGAAGRIRRARERLSRDEARAATAAALSMHLEDEGAQTDGGLPPVELSILEVDLSTGARRSLASIGQWDSASLAGSKRRSRISDAVVRELEADAFGSRGDAKRTIEPLSEQHPGDVSDDFTTDVETRLDLADLIARTGLSPREQELFDLLQRGMTQSDIAKAMGVGLGTVKSTLSHARGKLTAEAMKNFPEYRKSA